MSESGSKKKQSTSASSSKSSSKSDNDGNNAKQGRSTGDSSSASGGAPQQAPAPGTEKDPKKPSSGNDADKGEAVSKDKLEALQRSLAVVEGVLLAIAEQKLTGVDAVDYIMRNSIDVQRVATLQQLRHHCENEDPGAIMDMLRSCSLSVSVLSVEVQSALAKGFGDVLPLLDEPRMRAAVQTINIVLTVCHADSVQDWRKLHLTVLHSVAVEFIRDTALPDVISMTLDATRPVDVRLFNLDALCQILDDHKELALAAVPTFEALVADGNVQVRAACSNILVRLCRALPVYYTREVLLLDVVTLLLDEEPTVTASVYKRLIDVTASFDSDFVLEVLLPLFRRYATNAPLSVQSTVVESLGVLMWNARSVLPRTVCDDWNFFIDLFVTSAESSNVDYRQFCAFNLPGVFSAVPFEYMEQVLMRVVESLIRDTVVPVRMTVAAGFHEIASKLCSNPRSVDALRQTAALYTTLLNDADTKVKDKAMPHLTKVLKVLADVLPPSDARSFYAAIASSTTAYEASVRTNWRKVAELFFHIPEFLSQLSAREVIELFMPMMTWHLQLGAAALNGIVANNVSNIIRNCRTDDDRREAVKLITGLVRSLSSAKSAQSRAGFIDLAGVLCGTCSNAFVERYLCQPLMYVTNDKLLAMRIKLAKNLVRFERIPCLKSLAQKLRAAANADAEAVVRAEIALTSMERTSTTQAASEFDAERDAALEAQEGALLSPAFITDVLSVPDGPSPDKVKSSMKPTKLQRSLNASQNQTASPLVSVHSGTMSLESSSLTSPHQTPKTRSQRTNSVQSSGIAL